MALRRLTRSIVRKNLRVSTMPIIFSYKCDRCHATQDNADGMHLCQFFAWPLNGQTIFPRGEHYQVVCKACIEKQFNEASTERPELPSALVDAVSHQKPCIPVAVIRGGDPVMAAAKRGII